MPSSYTGHGSKFVTVKATADGLEFTTASGWVPSTGGTFTGVVTIAQATNDGFVIKTTDVGGTPGTAQGGDNYLVFHDSDGDIQIRIGSNSSGDLYLKSLVAGRQTVVDQNLNVQGNITLTGLVDTVDIAAFKTAYDAHIGAANPHGTNMEDLSDVPAYSGNALKIPRINAGATAIEWIVATSADKYFLHTQSTPSVSWVVNHSMGKYPSVTLMDGSGNVIEADNIQHTDLNSTTITLSESITGTAAFN